MHQIIKNILTKSFLDKNIPLFFKDENYFNEVISIYFKINFEKSLGKASSCT